MVENSLGKSPLEKLKRFEDTVETKLHEIGVWNSLGKLPLERLKRFVDTIETNLMR